MITNKYVLGLCCTFALAAVLALAGCSRQQSDWQKTRETNTAEAYEQFLKKYPSGEFTAQAQARVKELYEERDWQKARDADTPEAYQAFVKQYPEGKWTEEARIRIENFTLAQAPGASGPGGASPGNAAPAGAESGTAANPAPDTAQSGIPFCRRGRRIVRSATGGVQVRSFGRGTTLDPLAKGVSECFGGTVSQSGAKANGRRKALSVAGRRSHREARASHLRCPESQVASLRRGSARTRVGA
jgi:hypothetical protein